MNGWGVGEIEPILDLMRDGEVIAQHIRFGPGALIPVREWRWPDPCCWVLDAIGGEVQEALTWEWPPPYNGEQRRAGVRIREKAAKLEHLYQRTVLDSSIYNPNAHFKIASETISAVSP